MKFLIPLCLAVSGRDVSQNDQQDTLAVVDTFRDVLAGADPGEIEQRVSGPAISRLIRRRSENDGLFGRPICILAYWLAEQNPRNLMENRPFGSPDADLRDVLADFGIDAR